MANRIEFINLSYPSQGSSSTLRRRAYSHAARVNHARVKLARESTSQINDKEPHAPSTEEIKAGTTTEAKEVPVLLPEPIDPLTSSRRDPFGCFVRPLSQLEHYLFDHYANVVTTQYDSQCVILRDTSFHHHQLRTSWIQMAISYVGLLHYALQFSCNNIGESHHFVQYAALATQYKILCISAIKEAVGARDCSVRGPVVATIISLALDELRTGNITASRQHVRALAKMVQFSGGLQSLGMDGLLKHIFEKLAYDMGLLVDDETSPSTLMDFVNQGGINMSSAFGSAATY
ncbi:uncharacterized protein TrAtP1_007305 [Trichoderma atroviride]|uniref:uncharacterized protein n=1 Tax=Hypocrea atroviridis TaxID=63577 RepID=UPI003327A285|nr:hypothetical protein TrAtP1_007305 [Trichoderma atroviride]